MNCKEELCHRTDYTVEDVFRLVEILRGEDGCPWDREQTHASLRNNLLEEAYEVAEGIDRGDPAVLCEELGDYLFQAAFHILLGEEGGAFTRAEVFGGICRKMISRHPHVFGDRGVMRADEVSDSWDAIKQKEKNEETLAASLLAVPRAMPALMRAEKVLSRARRRGGVREDFSARLDRSVAALRGGENGNGIGAEDRPPMDAELLGELLLALVGLAGEAGISAEEALSHATDRYAEQIIR